MPHFCKLQVLLCVEFSFVFGMNTVNVKGFMARIRYLIVDWYQKWSQTLILLIKHPDPNRKRTLELTIKVVVIYFALTTTDDLD